MSSLPFFNNTGQFRDYTKGLSADKDLKIVKPYFESESWRIIAIIGDDIWTELKTHFESEDIDEVKDNMVSYIQSALANFTTVHASTIENVNLL